MNVGIVGLGKLGLPVACAMASRGLHVYGYDKRPEAMQLPDSTAHEAGLRETIKAATGYLHFAGLAQLVEAVDVIFVAVETPHEPRFEGVTPLPDDRADFDYSSLKAAVAQIACAAYEQRRHVTISVISTVLPGTMRREIIPLLNPQYCTLVYNPSFIAMGTTIRDFLDPEFVLLGGDTDGRVEAVYEHVYGAVDKPRHVRTTVENAELIKVAYNTFIGLKIAFANTLMEVCHKTGCDVDEVTGALKLAHRRLISPAYMDGGMGDGGGCHPRDNIALSWLARELDLSHDLFQDAMVAREDHARWLADLMCEHAARTMLPKIILGYAYKPNSRITTGSPARLVHEILEHRGEQIDMDDPVVAGIGPFWPDYPAVFLIGCRHDCFPEYVFPRGSVVIDPFRYIPDQPGVEVVRLGQWARARTGTSASTSQRLAA